MFDFLPPSHPPPFLSEEQLLLLCEQGHLAIQLPQTLQDSYNELAAAVSVFFDQPILEKRSQYPSSQRTELGYYMVREKKEYLTLRHSTTSDLSSLEQITQKTWHQTATLMHRIIVGISEGLDIDPEAWDPIVRGCLQMPTHADPTSPTLLRMFRYYPDAGVSDEHTDVGLLTLCVGAQRGLQVWQRHDPFGDLKQGEWADANGPTLLIGSTLRGLCSSKINAGLHRVVANEKGRESLVFALRPVKVKELDLTPFGGSGTVDMGEFWSLLQKSRVCVNATQDVQEKQRIEMRKLRAALTGKGVLDDLDRSLEQYRCASNGQG